MLRSHHADSENIAPENHRSAQPKRHNTATGRVGKPLASNSKRPALGILTNKKNLNVSKKQQPAASGRLKRRALGDITNKNATSASASGFGGAKKLTLENKKVKREAPRDELGEIERPHFVPEVRNAGRFDVPVLFEDDEIIEIAKRRERETEEEEFGEEFERIIAKVGERNTGRFMEEKEEEKEQEEFGNYERRVTFGIGDFLEDEEFELVEGVEEMV